MTEERATPHCRGRGELRQQTAARLVDVDDPVVHSVRFTIYASYTDHDLASQPAAWRGALSGTGDLDVQIDVTVQGPMDKAHPGNSIASSFPTCRTPPTRHASASKRRRRARRRR